jgi:hypothetical protein
MNIIEVDGKWQVVEGERVLHVAETNAEAWRWLDRRAGEPVSRSEKVSGGCSTPVFTIPGAIRRAASRRSGTSGGEYREPGTPTA